MQVSGRFAVNLDGGNDMQSPPGNPETPNVVRLCGFIKRLIEEHVNSHQAASESDIEPFRLEVQTLYQFLNLFEKIRAAKETKLDVEESHTRDVNHLLRRCHRTLLNLHRSLKQLKDHHVESIGQAKLWDLETPTFTVSRFYISFYTRTLEVFLIGINLIHRWKNRLPQDGTDFQWDELSEATRNLRITVIQRRNLTGGGDHEESVEEMGLLRDVEQCIRSAEDLMTVAPGRSVEGSQSSIRQVNESQIRNHSHPPTNRDVILPLRNGSGTSSSPPTSKAEDHASDDSDLESIDFELEHDVGFSKEVYSSMITTLKAELMAKLENRNYRDAEIVCKTLMKHSVDREANLGLSFDDRAELEIILAEIHLEQRRFQKVKKLVRQLLQDTTMDPDCRSRLHLFLAKAYLGRDQLLKAQSCARNSLRAREELYGLEHDQTKESATVLIRIYEQHKDYVTANALREIYCPNTLPSPPPRSALRPGSKRRPPSPPQIPHDIHPPLDQAPPDYHEENHLHSRNHVRWAPDVWTNESSINAPINELGQTPLIYAIHQADEMYVKLNIERKANINKTCADGISPLMHAVTLGRESIVEILLKEGANVDTRTSCWTPLHKATDLGSLTIMRLLLASGADIEAQAPLDYVQPRSKNARLRALANDEPDPEAEIASEKEHRWTPLLRAASNGKEAVVRLLLDYNANIEAQSPSNATPLMYACEHLDFPVVDLLLMRGAKVSAADQYGWCPLHYCLVNAATRSAEVEQVITLLLSHELDVNVKCNYNKSAIHYAVEKSSAETVIFLLVNGADIESRDIAERTPLHTAIECRLEPMVRLLLEQGADASAMTRAGDDGLAAARYADRKSPEIISLLTKNKKKMQRENSDAAAGRKPRKPTFGSSRRTSVGGSSAGDAVAESLKLGARKGWFGSRSGKGQPNTQSSRRAIRDFLSSSPAIQRFLSEPDEFFPLSEPTSSLSAMTTNVGVQSDTSDAASITTEISDSCMPSTEPTSAPSLGSGIARRVTLTDFTNLKVKEDVARASPSQGSSIVHSNPTLSLHEKANHPSTGTSNPRTTENQDILSTSEGDPAVNDELEFFQQRERNYQDRLAGKKIITDQKHERIRQVRHRATSKRKVERSAKCECASECQCRSLPTTPLQESYFPERGSSLRAPTSLTSMSLGDSMIDPIRIANRPDTGKPPLIPYGSDTLEAAWANAEQVFMGDQRLHHLFHEALVKQSRDQVLVHGVQLLELFGRRLMVAAKTPAEKKAASFFLRQKHDEDVVHNILQATAKETSAERREGPGEQHQSESPIEAENVTNTTNATKYPEGVASGYDEKRMEDIGRATVKSFFDSSGALERLREELDDFASPFKSETMWAKRLWMGEEQVRFELPHTSSPLTRIDQSKLALEKQLGMPILWWPFKQPRKQLSSDRVRMILHHRCGLETYIDVSHDNARRYRQMLNIKPSQFMAGQTPILPTVNTSSASSGLKAEIQGWASALKGKSSNLRQRFTRQSQAPPENHELEQNRTTTQQNSRNSRYIHWCVDSAPQRTLLYPICMESKKGKAFLDELYKSYRTIRGWRWYLSMTTCAEIKLVNHKSIYEPEKKVVKCCHERDQVLPKHNEQHEYTYVPSPNLDEEHHICIAEQALIHYYHGHETCQSATNHFDRSILPGVPHRVNGAQIGPKGYGIWARQGWTIPKMAAFVLITQGWAIAFVVFWLCYHPGDIQNAFTPALYSLGLVTIFVAVPDIYQIA